MKRYTMRDESSGQVTAVDKGLTLLAVNDMTDWYPEDFDKISEMAVGEKLEFKGITVERTE